MPEAVPGLHMCWPTSIAASVVDQDAFFYCQKHASNQCGGANSLYGAQFARNPLVHLLGSINIGNIAPVSVGLNTNTLALGLRFCLTFSVKVQEREARSCLG